MRGTPTVLILALYVSLSAAQEPFLLSFDAGLATGAAEPLEAAGVALVASEQGQAAELGLSSRLAYAPPAFLTEGFDIRLRVRHEQSLPDLHYREIVYLYHETPDGKNRICLQKRGGTDYILFSMSDGTGKAKGAAFADNWFALKTPPLQWAAGTWHELRLIADRARGQAALHVDGAPVVAAEGTQFPQAIGDRLWLGSLAGRSCLQGRIDDVSILPVEGEGQ